MNTPRIETARMLQARFASGAFLRNRWVLVAVAVVALAAIVAMSWNWLVAAGLASILLSLVPCLVMCGLGLCMHRFIGGSGPSGSVTGEPGEGAAQAATDNSAIYTPSCCGGASLSAPANTLPETFTQSKENSNA